MLIDPTTRSARLQSQTATAFTKGFSLLHFANVLQRLGVGPTCSMFGFRTVVKEWNTSLLSCRVLSLFELHSLYARWRHKSRSAMLHSCCMGTDNREKLSDDVGAMVDLIDK